MEIRGVGGVNPLEESGKSSKSTQTPKSTAPSASDSMNISSEAKRIQEESLVKEVLDRTPDIDMERVARVKERLENGYYDNKEVLDVLADRLAKVLGL